MQTALCFTNQSMQTLQSSSIITVLLGVNHSITTRIQPGGMEP